jgi:hypothetical protein
MPAPARPPEEEAERPEQEEEQEERDQTAQETETKSEWAMERRPISIIWIWHGRGLTGWRLDGDRRSLGHTCLEGKEGNSRNRGNQHQRRYDT